MLTQSPQSEPTWQAILHLLRWDKPAGRLILMIPALWAVVLAAEGRPPLGLLGVIVLGSLATSAAGCVVNDLWDRKIDAQVSRTRHRPLAAKALSVKVGLGVAAVAFACAWDWPLTSIHSAFGWRWRQCRLSCCIRWPSGYSPCRSW